MNKKLIALAVGAALASPMAAHAGATAYGHGQVEIGFHGGDKHKGTSVVDAARGRIGLKGSEDLGGGLTALFKAEFKADFADGDSNSVSTTIPEALVGASGVDANGDGDTTDDITLSKSTEALSKRELMVGLKGGFGEINMGRVKQAYKYTGGVKYDPFVTTLHQARGTTMSGGALGHNSFLSDSVSYKNKFGAITAWITYDLDNGGSSSDTGANAMTAAIKFSGGNFEAFYKMADEGAEGDSYSASSFGGQFKTGNITINAQLEMTEKGTNETDYTFIGATMKMGKNNLVFQYGIKDTGATNDTTKMTLGAIHKFSKKTRGFAGYSVTDDGTDANTVISAGLRVDI